MVVAFYPPAERAALAEDGHCGAATVPTPPEVDLYLDSRMVPAFPIRPDARQSMPSSPPPPPPTRPPP